MPPLEGQENLESDLEPEAIIKVISQKVSQQVFDFIQGLGDLIREKSGHTRPVLEQLADSLSHPEGMKQPLFPLAQPIPIEAPQLVFLLYLSP